MGVGILSRGDAAAFYCSASDWVFGPLMTVPRSLQDQFDDAHAFAEAHLRWLGTDPRLLEPEEHAEQLQEFIEYREGFRVCGICGEWGEDTGPECETCTEESQGENDYDY